MDGNRTMQEDLLYAWMQMSVSIRGNRILSGFSFNEMMLCGLLYRRQKAALPPLTATELGDEMHLLKSQINHILTAMEKDGMVTRTRSTQDKRSVHVQLTETGCARYEEEHAHVMEIIGLIHDDLGDENTQQLTRLISRATELVCAYSER